MMNKSNVTFKIVLLLGEFFAFSLAGTSLIFHIYSQSVNDEVEKVFPVKFSIICDILMCISIIVMYSAIILEISRVVLIVLAVKIMLALAPDVYHFLGFEWNMIHDFEIYTIIRAAILGMKFYFKNQILFFNI